MAKIDKSKYTKEEYRKLREQKKLRKQSKRLEKITNKNLSQDPLIQKNNILCLKHGTKYSAKYVNTLYNMCKRHCSLPFDFYCLTEDQRDIDKDIKIIPLPAAEIQGWWYKPYIYSNDLPIEGTILFLDLDLVICNNIDNLFLFQPKKYCALRDFTRAMRPGWQKYNSSVVRFEKGQLDFVWTEFIKNPKNVIRRFFGDQDWLWEQTRGQATYWPESWIKSWKWEIRKEKAWKPGGVKGNRTFEKIENVTAPNDCCIVAFHGDPNPDNCFDPYIVDNWK
jgi:hypothetical protein